MTRAKTEKQREQELNRLPIVQFAKELAVKEKKGDPKFYIFSPEDFERKEIVSTLNLQGVADWKPQGLWFSLNCDWVKYLYLEYSLAGEKWALSRLKQYSVVYRIKPNDERLCVLNTKDDVIDFTKKFGVFAPSRRMTRDYPCFINWDLVASKYHGLMVMGKYRKWWSEFLWLSEWDSPGGCIFDRRAIRGMAIAWEL